eukprot:332706-Prorocentrum_minimum.AAC.1
MGDLPRPPGAAGSLGGVPRHDGGPRLGGPEEAVDGLEDGETDGQDAGQGVRLLEVLQPLAFRLGNLRLACENFIRGGIGDKSNSSAARRRVIIVSRLRAPRSA